MRVCDLCGVALDGVQRREHTIAVVRDGLLLHGAHYCVRHAEELEREYREARARVADRLLLVAAGGGEA